MKQYLQNSQIEPFRFFFPCGILSLLLSVAIWLPQLWLSDFYPIIAHKTFILNGFISFFIAGFLMTAVPKFSKTHQAKKIEVILFFIATLLSLISALAENNFSLGIFSTLQAMVLIAFLLTRIKKRKENVPFSFIFIFVGLIMWFLSGVLSNFYDSNSFSNIHYEGAIISIILGVATRLVPGIFGDSEIVGEQRKKYEPAKSLISSIPTYFLLIVLCFVTSYFLSDNIGAILRVVIITFIALKFWKLYKLPKIKTALTKCLWINAWCIVLSFALKAIWPDGLIHASHAFFLSGILLICLLVATRVLQAHGPGDITLENSNYLYVITFLIVLAAATRVSAYAIEGLYYKHLGYSSILIVFATLLWSGKYLKYVLVKNPNH